ncbi:MAG: hypothetical protein U1E60_32290 [Reyranellaceae bacterium]
MKKAKDEMRAAYKRSDFQTLERGKFHTEVAKGTSVVVLEPSIAKAFPTSDAVNAALSGLLELSERMRRRNRPALRARAKAVRAG